MTAVFFFASVAAAIFYLLAGRQILKRRRRRRLRAAPVPASVPEILARNTGIYELLPDDLKAELHGHINVFLDEKRFVGCGGLEINDDIGVTIAGLACVLLLNREATYFPGFTSILVYPDAYVTTETHYDGVVETESESHRAGEAWHRGPVVLSWNDVTRGSSDTDDGYNVVLHEFAHKLDEEAGATNGMPILDRVEQRRKWADVFGAEFEALDERAAKGANRVLDEYGLTSPAEFFAVATESFFEKGAQMQQQLPELYEQLRGFYRVDPASWVRKRAI